MEQKFYKCEHCGKMVALIKESGVPIMCCGKKMNEIIPNTTDAATEKHVPIYVVQDNVVTVTIGNVPHPMELNHYIEWVSIQTKQGSQLKDLKPEREPKIEFALLPGDEVEAVYAYCNLHGLWKNTRGGN